MKKKFIIAAVIGLVLLGSVFAIWFFIGKNTAEKQTMQVKVKKGDFHISITATGQIEANSSDFILGPANLKNLGIWQIKISSLVPDGSVVKKGDIIATLDPSEINNKIRDIQADIDKNIALLNKTKLDTTQDLRNERDKLASLKINLDQAKVTLEQSKYEPPATIKRAEIDVEKNKLSYEQAVKNYYFKKDQAISKFQDINNSMKNSKDQIALLSDALKTLTVRAPKNGIVIYKIDRGIDKIATGSMINTGVNIIATMPDLSQVISKTYINEMDISRVNEGMDAEVSIDAFPGKNYDGKVLSIANIGETIPHSAVKVFNVKILINSKDPALKPSMTTKNTILINTVKDALFIPIDCIFNENNILFVYKVVEGGYVRQQVQTGLSNANEIIVTKGLSENDEVSLAVPDEPDKLKLIRIPD